MEQETVQHHGRAADDVSVSAEDTRLLSGLTVWVVEDDPELLDLMLDDLRWRGAEVVGLHSGEALYRELAVRRCDVVVLDVGLPGEDGYSIAAHLRKAGDMGIVMLTGRGSPADMARGLTLGVDLYLVKPLDLEVLAAGLLSLRRRLQPSAVAKPLAPPRPPSVGTWRLDDDDWELRAPNGGVLALTEAERAFLRELFIANGRTVGREQLIAAVTDQPWNFDPHRLEVLVHRLRTRTRSATDATLPIRAVRGTGYRLAL